MTRRFFHALAMSLFLLGASTLTAAPALAQDALAAAKSAGQVGERPDGLVGPVTAPTPLVETLVAEVNTQRLARYKEIARGNGTALDKVQAVAGQQLIERTPAGQFVMMPGGQWKRK